MLRKSCMIQTPPLANMCARSVFKQMYLTRRTLSTVVHVNHIYMRNLSAPQKQLGREMGTNQRLARVFAPEINVETESNSQTRYVVGPNR